MSISPSSNVIQPPVVGDNDYDMTQLHDQRAEEEALFGSASDVDPEDEDEADLSHFAGTNDDHTLLSNASPQRNDFIHTTTTNNVQYNNTINDKLPILEVELTDLPRVNPDDQVYQFDLPRFLRVEPKRFLEDTYESIETDDPHELNPHIDSTMRWRTVSDPNTGAELIESNSQFIEWSDGTYSIMVGDELYDVGKIPISGHHYLVNVQAAEELIVCEAPIRERLNVKVPDASVAAKRFRASKSSARRTHGTQLIELDFDPEREQQERIQAEKELAKAQKKMDAQKKRMAKRYGIQGDDDDDNNNNNYDNTDGSRHRRNKQKNNRTRRGSNDLITDSDSYNDNDDNDIHSETRSNRNRRNGGSDDLGGFVVSDDEEIVEFNEEDEEEERAEMLRGGNSRRRSENTRASRAEALARQRGANTNHTYNDDGDMDDTDTYINARGMASNRRAVLDEDEDNTG